MTRENDEQDARARAARLEALTRAGDLVAALALSRVRRRLGLPAPALDSFDRAPLWITESPRGRLRVLADLACDAHRAACVGPLAPSAAVTCFLAINACAQHLPPTPPGERLEQLAARRAWPCRRAWREHGARGRLAGPDLLRLAEAATGPHAPRFCATHDALARYRAIHGHPRRLWRVACAWVHHTSLPAQTIEAWIALDVWSPELLARATPDLHAHLRDHTGWRDAGVCDPDAARAWFALGFTARWVASLRARSLDLDAARAWITAGVAPRDLDGWLRAGVTDPEGAAAMRRAGLGLKAARARGALTPLPPDHPLATLPAHLAHAWLRAGVERPEVVDAWRAQGVTCAPHAARLRRAGLRDPTHLAPWRAAGFSPAQVAAHLEAGARDPAAAMARDRDHNTPPDADAWRALLGGAQPWHAWRDLGVLRAADARAWIEAGVSNRYLAAAWHRLGVPPAEAAPWCALRASPSRRDALLALGCDPERLSRWRDAGFGLFDVEQLWQPFAGDPDEARRWSVLASSPRPLIEWRVAFNDDLRHARRWRRLDVPPAQARYLLDAGIPAGRVQRWRKAGAEVRAVLHHGQATWGLAPITRWTHHGLAPAEAAAWLNAGARDPAAALRWRDAGWEPDHDAQRWLWAGVDDPDVARAWGALRCAPHRVVQILDAGRSLDDLTPLLDAGLSPDEAPLWLALTTPDVALRWRARGVSVAFFLCCQRLRWPLEVATRLLDASVTVVALDRWMRSGLHDVPLLPWLAAGFSVTEAIAWRRACSALPSQAAALRAQELRPVDLRRCAPPAWR